MDTLDPVPRRPQLLLGEPHHLPHIGRVENLIASYIPVVDTFIDCTHGKRIALFAIPQGSLGILPDRNITDRTDQPDGTSSEVTRGCAAILDPAIDIGFVANPIFGIEYRRCTRQVRTQRSTV